MNGDIIVPITFVAAIFGILFLYLRSRHRERIAMIERGVTADSIENKAKRASATLKVGMLCVGIGVGILMGYLVDRIFNPEDSSVFYFAFIFLFGGLGLILNYKIEPKKKNGF
ncbi:DUF6249 domain-containing protein [Poritiphilus flavus]|uniref:DUF6249 domain-containing protein n=1 Tax=Poritiphilus flavus TaxID=2697053 RepID=A0A6L9EBN5_9FLAO|nr:DUF6249 domain-containing protein [Poritiphilus flavus]NAS12145.1 hypothetical protein [Poritiphilus flavus]